MPLIKKDNTFGFYSHIPKCAGSSIVDSLNFNKAYVLFHRYKSSGKKEDFKSVARLHLRDYPPYPDNDKEKIFPDNSVPCSWHHWHLSLSKYYFNLDKCEYKFAVVRDPVDRLVSEYRFRQRTYCPANDTTNWHHYDLGSHSHEMVTDDFSYWLRVCHEGSLLNPYIWDNHFRPQCEFVEPGFDIIPFNIQKINGYLKEKIAATQGIPWINKSQEIEATFTKEDRQFIEEWYNKDYELFANQKDYNWI